MVNVGVPLTDAEQRTYEDLSEKIGDKLNAVLGLHSEALAGVSDVWVFRRLQQVMGKIGSGKASDSRSPSGSRIPHTVPLAWYSFQPLPRCASASSLVMPYLLRAASAL